MVTMAFGKDLGIGLRWRRFR